MRSFSKFESSTLSFLVYICLHLWLNCKRLHYLSLFNLYYIFYAESNFQIPIISFICSNSLPLVQSIRNQSTPPNITNTHCLNIQNQFHLRHRSMITIKRKTQHFASHKFIIKSPTPFQHFLLTLPPIKFSHSIH